jgi:energy-coupling factor transport system permease protein
VHPAAWWVWAAGVVVLAGRTGDPVVLGVLAVSALGLAVLGRRRAAAPFTGYLLLGVGIVVVRVVFHVLVGIKPGGRVLLDLPVWHLAWAPGVDVLGPVTTTGLAGAALGGLRLAVMVLAIGAVATASAPARLLRALPAALHHVATALVIALGVAPSLARAVGSARRARRLRGLPSRGPRALAQSALPVLADALDRALDLAASMDARGYARLHGAHDRRVAPMLIAALLATVLGTYGLLTGALAYAVPSLAGGVLLAVLGGAMAGGRSRRTRYRSDPWTVREWLVTGSGAVVVVGAAVGLPAPLLAGVAVLGLAALVRLPEPAEVVA